MLSYGVIEPSNSSYSSPVVLATKPDGTWRFCIDFRLINKLTQAETYPIPSMRDNIARLSGYVVWCIIDLKSAYWQIIIAPGDRDKTAFITHFGLFQFTRMPFGLINAPRFFQRIMNKLFFKLSQHLELYLDDLLLKAKSTKEMIWLLEEVFKIIRQHELQVNLKKCRFFMDEIDYLGFHINQHGVRPIADKLQGIQDMEPPANIKQVQSFLGMCGVFRRFIPKYADMAFHLNQLIRKYTEERITINGKTRVIRHKNQWRWTVVEQDSFQAVKAAVLSDKCVLEHPDHEKPFDLYCDASEHTLGAALMQDGKLIMAASRHLKDFEVHIHIREKELKAIIYALDKFKYYVEGAEIKVYCDHKPITNLHKIKLDDKLVRYLSTLLHYDWTVQFIEGKDNVVADAITRMQHKLEERLSIMTSREVEGEVMGIFVDALRIQAQDKKNPSH